MLNGKNKFSSDISYFRESFSVFSGSTLFGVGKSNSPSQSVLALELEQGTSGQTNLAFGPQTPFEGEPKKAEPHHHHEMAKVLLLFL